MAVVFGTGNTSVHYNGGDDPEYTLPDADWAWMMAVRSDILSSGFQYVLSTNQFVKVPGINVFFNSPGDSTMGVYGNSPPQSANDPPLLGQWRILYLTRRSGNVYVGSTTIGPVPSSYETLVANVAGTTSNGLGLIFGGRYDLDVARFFRGSASWLTLVKGSGITSPEVANIAKGQDRLLSSSVAPNIALLWEFTDHTAATVIDSINGKVLTRVGTMAGTTTDPLILTPSVGIVSIFENDKARQYLSSNGYANYWTYNDALLAFLRDYHSTTVGTLPDLLSSYIKMNGTYFP